MDINIFGVESSVNYLGMVTGAYTPSKIEGVLFVPTGTRWTTAQCVAIKTTVNALMKHNTATSRAYVMKNFEAYTPKNTDATFQTEAYGSMYKVRGGKYGFAFMYKKGGLALHAAFGSFDEMQDSYDAILIDKNNNCLLGTKKMVDGVPYFAGFSLATLAQSMITLNDGNNDTKFGIEFTLQDSDELDKNPAIVRYEKTDKIMDNINGLIGLELEVSSPLNGSALVKFKIKAGNGKKNMFTDYSTALATTSLWTVTNATGGAITVSSVTATSLGGGDGTFDVQLSAVDTDYSSLSTGAPITVYIGSNSALETAGATGFGDVTLIISKP